MLTPEQYHAQDLSCDEWYDFKAIKGRTYENIMSQDEVISVFIVVIDFQTDRVYSLLRLLPVQHLHQTNCPEY